MHPAPSASRIDLVAEAVDVSAYGGERYPYPLFGDGDQQDGLIGFGVTFPKETIADGDILGLTKALVAAEITRNLAGLDPVVVPQGKLGWGELRFVPRTLRDALWLQLAEAVCGEKTYRECLVCGKPFEISPDVARTNRRLCSDTCKVRAYRRRKTRAGRLWEQGHPLPQIAQELGSEEAKVRKWIARHLAARGAAVPEIAARLRLSVKETAKLLTKKGA